MDVLWNHMMNEEFNLFHFVQLEPQIRNKNCFNQSVCACDLRLQ